MVAWGINLAYGETQRGWKLDKQIENMEIARRKNRTTEEMTEDVLRGHDTALGNDMRMHPSRHVDSLRTEKNVDDALDGVVTAAVVGSIFLPGPEDFAFSAFVGKKGIDIVLSGGKRVLFKEGRQLAEAETKAVRDEYFLAKKLEQEACEAAASKAVRSAPKVATTSTSQLQKKFKHAGDFGVAGNPNKANLEAFDNAIQSHLQSPGTQKIAGTYRGDPVNIHVDPTTGLAVITDPAGNFISGWKLSAQQLWHVLNGGKLGGG